jgi:hypothetical protein
VGVIVGRVVEVAGGHVELPELLLRGHPGEKVLHALFDGELGVLAVVGGARWRRYAVVRDLGLDGLGWASLHIVDAFSPLQRWYLVVLMGFTCSLRKPGALAAAWR